MDKDTRIRLVIARDQLAHALDTIDDRSSVRDTQSEWKLWRAVDRRDFWTVATQLLLGREL